MNHTRCCLPRPCLVILIACVTASASRSQESDAPGGESRVEHFCHTAGEKLREAKPYEPDKVENLVRKLIMIFSDPSGLYPYFGSVYNGGGLTGGAGYRRFYGDNASWHIQGLYSVSNYKLIEGGTESKDHMNRQLSFGSRLGWRDATQVPYYGLGTNSSPDGRTNFRFQQTYADGHGAYRPIRWAVMTGSLAYERWEVKQGQGDFPSIETQHTPQTAPGLDVSPSYVHSQVSAGIDWRQSPGYSRRGGLYQMIFHDYHNTGGGTYGFQKVTGEIVQYLPLLRETWVLAARGRVDSVLNDNDVVPYYMLPALGNGSTLRAFSTDRFRDRHSMLMNAEFRWLPAVGLDMALFYDAGKVTAHRNDLSFKGLKSNVGIGARFHGPLATPLRIDLAVGNEGWRIVLSGGPGF